MDDGSDVNMRQSLFNFSIENSHHTPINFYSNGRNKGVGYQFETAYKIADSLENIDLVCFIEADYIWRKGWLEDIIAVFEASQHTVAISGVDHPDHHEEENIKEKLPTYMIAQFGHDLEQRDSLYKPFYLKTSRGDIQVQGVSNSCGCLIINWSRLKKILNSGDRDYGLSRYSTKKYWDWMEKSFHKNGYGNRKLASDAYMSGTLSMFAEYYMIDNSIDLSKNFGFLSISDHSISQHVCGMGINGSICKEGETFVSSPSWNNEFLNRDPRQ